MSSARGKRGDPLAKKIPENPKFKHVQATVDTGASVTRHLAKLEEMRRDYKFKKGEIFKRMKVTTFVQLIVQVAEYDSVSQYDTHAAEHNNGFSDPRTPYRPDTADREVQAIQSESGGGDFNEPAFKSPGPESSRSRLEEVIRGVGEIDLHNQGGGGPPRPIVNGTNCPYLMLDIRDKDAYDECHIITAKNYPTAMLARSVNYETKDMLRFKNQDGKIIIVYDNDESLAHRGATTLVERGYDNLFVLSGGLKVASRIFPEGLITGAVPPSLIEPQPQSKGKTPSQPPTAREPADKDKEDFSQEDLDRLTIYIDNALSDNSSGSRLSQRSKGPPGRTSTAMSAMSSSSVATAYGRPPFK